jgi:hypothetical protein
MRASSATTTLRRAACSRSAVFASSRQNEASRLGDLVVGNVYVEGADLGGSANGGTHAYLPVNTVIAVGSVDDDEERLPLPDVPHRVNRLGRHHQDFAVVVRLRRLSVDLILERAFEDVDDLLARMLVPHGRRFRGELDAVLDDLASGTLRSCCCRSVRQSPGACSTGASIATPVGSEPTKTARSRPLAPDATRTPSLQQPSSDTRTRASG